MLDKYLIEHCSPTLASLKSANLFSVNYHNDKELEEQVERWNRQLTAKGVTLMVLHRQPGTALIYVCRKRRLQQDWQKPGAARFLAGYGYAVTDVEDALNRLKIRLAESETFPHEIGLFLGYPLKDVVGFIHNAGKNCKCAGCWKVYGDECEAVKIFSKFKKCRDVYKRHWEQGKSVWQLTVSA